MVIDKRKLKHYLDNNLNVLLIGEAGIGKTEVARQVLQESGLKWIYFSASTLDPWVDFVGIPREVDGKIKMLRPEYFNENEVEAILLDEYSRAHKKVRNAALELIQFKSINGIKFPKLKVVWAAINPYDDNHTYDVDKLDPAQLDRFHIHLNVPYDVDDKYFEDKYGKNGKVACEWWRNIPIDIRKTVSPRRLDYALAIYSIDGDLRDTLPEESNIKKLIFAMSKGSISEQIEEVIKKDNKTWIQDDNNYSAAIDYILAKNKYKDYFLPHIKPEKLTALITEKYDVLKYAAHNYYWHDTLRNVIDSILINADRNLQTTISNAIKGALPAVEKTNWDIFGEFPIVCQSFPGKKYDGETFQKSPADRKKALISLSESLVKTPTAEQADQILAQLDKYCECSWPKTVYNNREHFFPSLNTVVQTYSGNTQEKYTPIFNKYKNLYSRLSAGGLFKFCVK